MFRMPSFARGVLATLVLSVPVAACVAVPGPRGYYVGGAVTLAPPAPRVEYYGTPPYPGYVWMGGYWRWTGTRYAWVGGHWAAPRRGYYWVPDRWVRGHRGWRHQRGYWTRR